MRRRKEIEFVLILPKYYKMDDIGTGHIKVSDDWRVMVNFENYKSATITVRQAREKYGYSY